MDTLFCQSCAMLLMEEKDFGTNSDGSKNEDYCGYCYKNGTYTSECTMDEMIETCIPFTIEGGTYPDASAARSEMQKYFPQLKRWKK